MPRSGIRQMVKPLILTIKHLYSILKKPRSRGISGALYLQPATAGVIFLSLIHIFKAAFTQGKIAMMFDVNNGGQQMHEQMAEAGYKNVRTIGWPTMAKGECEYVLGLSLIHI